MEASEQAFRRQQAVVSDLKARLEICLEGLSKAEGLCLHEDESLDQPSQQERLPPTLVSDGLVRLKLSGNREGVDGRLVCEHCLQEIEPEQFRGRLAAMRVSSLRVAGGW